MAVQLRGVQHDLGAWSGLEKWHFAMKDTKAKLTGSSTTQAMAETRFYSCFKFCIFNSSRVIWIIALFYVHLLDP